MHQKASAGKDLVQVGRDYFRHIQLNILSGNWGAVIVALIPLFLFLYGVKATGDTVAGVMGVKSASSQLPPDNSLLQAKDLEIRELKKQVEDFQQTNETTTKAQQQMSALQKALNDRQAELDKQKNLVLQKDQEIQALGVQVNDLKNQASRNSGSVEPSSGSQDPPAGTAQKSWCLQMAQVANMHKSLGLDTSAAKASLEEENCAFWGVSIP